MEDTTCHTIENKLLTHPQMSTPQRTAHYGKWVALNQIEDFIVNSSYLTSLIQIVCYI